MDEFYRSHAIVRAMLSYRHAFHAGNHADVLKHFILVQVLRYFNQKDKPYWYVDTHAGAGLYRLDSAHAQKNAEFADGIARLWNRDDLPTEIADYMAQVHAFNGSGKLRCYPGSPLIALQLMRADDRLRLFELHGTDFRVLCDNMAAAGKRASVKQSDGFADIKSVLPPAPRRGVVLIDPSYEDKRDYLRITATVKEAVARFATGTYLVWYPLLQRGDARQLPEKLRKIAPDWFDVALQVHAPREDGFGMHGSGMFIVNPPWTLGPLLAKAMPLLAQILAQDQSAGFAITTSG